MTRWARTKSAHRHEKVPGDATPWSKLKRTPEVRSFKDGRKGTKPNGMEGNQGGGGGLKRSMPEFKGTNFARQLHASEESIKKPFAVADVQGGLTLQNSKSQNRNKFQKKIHSNNSIKIELQKYGGGSNVQGGPTQKNSKKQNRKKFQKTIKQEVSFTPGEKSNEPVINSIKVEPKEMGEIGNSQQDLSSKKKKKQKKLKKGGLTSENHGIHTAEGNTTEKYITKEEKLPRKSLLLVKQEPTEFSMESKGNTDSQKSAKKRKRDSSQKNMDTSNVASVAGVQSNETELGTDARLKKKRNKKKKQKLSLQATNTTDLSKTSDSSEKHEIHNSQSNRTEVSTNTTLNKQKRNKLAKKKLKLKATTSEVRGQETDDQKRIDKEQKKSMHRLRLLAQREKKGITMLSDKAERKLYVIRKALKKRGKSPEEIKSILRKERRVAEQKFRKAQKTVCFRCRLQGHTVATCTTILEDDDQSMGICFRCGSTEHMLRRCPLPKTDDKLPFAKCFICESRGHLSSACPKNNLGVYPRGGACLLCKSVNHLKKDCPTLVKDEEEEEPFVAYRTTEFGSVDAEVSEEVQVSKKKKAKVVTF